MYIKATVLSFVVLSFLGCSTMSPYSQQSPINDALKTCGLGYTTEANLAFNAAYKDAEKNHSLDFKAGMQESLNTQIMAFANNAKDNNNSKEIIEMIKNSQECMIKVLDANRPMTRQDHINACKNSLQASVSGTNKLWPNVKNYFYHEELSKKYNNGIVMYAYVDTGGSSSYGGYYLCEISNGQYIGFQPIYQ